MSNKVARLISRDVSPEHATDYAGVATFIGRVDGADYYWYQPILDEVSSIRHIIETGIGAHTLDVNTGTGIGERLLGSVAALAEQLSGRVIGKGQTPNEYVTGVAPLSYAINKR